MCCVSTSGIRKYDLKRNIYIAQQSVESVVLFMHHLEKTTVHSYIWPPDLVKMESLVTWEKWNFEVNCALLYGVWESRSVNACICFMLLIIQKIMMSLLTLNNQRIHVNIIYVYMAVFEINKLYIQSINMQH